MIEFDVETRGLQWYAPQHEVFLVQFFDPDDEDCLSYPEVGSYGEIDAEMEEPTSAAVVLRHPEDREEIQRWLDKDSDFRAWNSKFDLHHLEAAGYTLPPQDRWHDGMLLAHILDERKAVGLQAVGDRLFGTDPWPEGAGVELEKGVKLWLAEETKRRRKETKDAGKEGRIVEFIRPNYSDVPDEIMYPYAAHDVELQRRICDVIEPKVLGETGDLAKVYELERNLLPALYDMEKLGMLIDRDGALSMELELERRLDELLKELRAMAAEAGWEPKKADELFNPNSGAQIGQVLQLRGADLSKAKKLKNGLPSTSADELEKIEDVFARRIEAYRSVSDLYSTNVWSMFHPKEDSFGTRYPYLAEDGRIHADTRQMGAHTGRMSTSPNVQNWPRDDLRLRHLVTSRPGYKLVAVDLDSIELRLLAAFAGEGKLLEMMKDEDADLHTYTAKMLGLKDKDRGEGGIESARQRGKKMNYLQIYQGGLRAISKWFGTNQSGSRELRDKYHRTFPEVNEFAQQIEFRLFDRGYVRTPWGRHHRAYNMRHADREAYKFVAALVQGTAADLFKDSVVKVHRAFREAKIDGGIVALTHDEILAEVREDEAPRAGEIIQHAMIDHPRITKIIPLGADVLIVDRWSGAKDPEFVPGWEQG